MGAGGDGSSAKPYASFEQALDAAKDGDTIVVRGKSTLNEKENEAAIPCVIDKEITIQGEGDSAALNVRTAGIVLGANVTITNIELNFVNRYHNAIFANGHRFTAINVTHGSGSREVHLFAGTIGAAAGLSFTATPGTNATFTLQNSEFGNIYAGSVADNSSVTMNVDISNSKAIGNIYGSGAQEYKPDEGSWFDMTELDPPVADTTYTAGDATVTVDGSTTLIVDGSGAKSMNVIVKNGNNRPLTLSGVTALTAQGGKVKVASINENAHVTLLNSAELDLSDAATGTDVKLATLASSNGTGKLILGKSHLLTIASTMQGTFALETPDSFQNASGEAAYDHTYIKAYIANDATVNFTPHSTQSTMQLVKIPGDGTAWTTWKTTAAPTVPTTVTKFETTESSVSTDSGTLQNGGITIPVTWESSDPASPFKSLSAIPFHYAVTYNGVTVESVDTENGGMYESSVTFANGPVIWITAGDASEQDALPDRMDIGGTLTAGVYTITIYAPKAGGSKIQQTLTLTVTDGTEAATATELTAPAADTQYTENDSVTLTAKVTSNGQPVGKGEVVFWINGTALGAPGQIKAVTLSADGMASTTVNASAANHFKINETNTVKASYRTVPGAYDASESAGVSIIVNEAATVTEDLAFTPSNIEAKIQKTNNTANLKWDAATNTLTILKDFTTKMPVLFIGFGEPVTLELNGHIMTFAISPALDVDSNVGLFTRDHTHLTIQDSSAAGTGALKSESRILKLESGSEVTLKSGTISGNPNGSGVVQSATTGDRTKFTMTGGAVQAASNKGIAGDVVDGSCLFMSNCDVQITDGTLAATDEQSNTNRVGGIRAMNGTKAEITGGTFTGFYDPCITATGRDVEVTASDVALESRFRTVMAQNAAKVTLKNCTVKQTVKESTLANFQFAAIFVNGGEVEVLKGTKPTTIENANVSSAAVWVQRYGDDLGKFTMTDGSITASANNAIYATGASNILLTDVAVKALNGANENAGICADNFSLLIMIRGSVTSAGKNALELYSGAETVLTDTDVDTTSGYAAIYAEGTTTAPTQLTINGGSVHAPNNNSIAVFGVKTALNNVAITNTATGWAGVFANAKKSGSDVKKSTITITGGSITVQDSCGLWIRGGSTVELKEDEQTKQSVTIANHAAEKSDSHPNSYAAVYVVEGSTLTATGGSITAATSSNAVSTDNANEQSECKVTLNSVAVNNANSGWPSIFVGENSTLAVNGGTVAAGTNSAIRSDKAKKVVVKDRANLTARGEGAVVYFDEGGTLEITDSTLANVTGEGLYVGSSSTAALTNTAVNVQDGYGIRAVGSAEAQASVTLTDSKVTVQDGMALYGENGTITVNSGSYYSKNNFAITGTTPYRFVINGGYFHGSQDTLDATRADGAKLTLPTGKVLSNANITAQERTDNDLGSDYWWRLAARTYTLSFETNGATTKPDDQQLEEGATPTKPVDPTKPGYRFLGWKNGDTIVDLDNFTMPANHVTLAAAWEAKTYTIRFDKGSQQDATGTVNDQTYVYDTADAKLTAEVFASDTKDFLGWSLSNTATTAGYPKEAAIDDALKAAMVNSEDDTVTLYAVWKDKPVADVTVTFDAQTNGGELADGSAATQTGKPGMDLTLPSVKDRIGFNFTGWWTAPADGIQITAPAVFPNANATYFAQWAEKAAVEVTFTSGDGVWNDNTTGIKNASTRPGLAATVPGTVSRAGYTFEGWQSDNNAYQDLPANAEKTDTIKEGQAVHYTPKWRANTYSIHFEKNSPDATGTVDPIEYIYDTAGVKLTTEVFTSTTHKMLGWSLDRTADTASYASGAEIDETLKNAMANSTDGTVTLYAIWTEKDAVTMTFNAGEGIFADNSKEKIESVHPGQQNTLPAAPTRDGYTFNGWASGNADYPDLAKGATQTPVAVDGKNASYTAKWIAKTYTIHFDANGQQDAQGTVNDQSYVYDTLNARLTTDVFTSPTHKMLGWGLHANGAATYPSGGHITDALKAAMVRSTDGKVTLYAIWTEKDAVTMTFNAGEGAFADNSKEKIESVRPGQQNPLPAAPTRDGYTFNGWASDSVDYPGLSKDATQTPVAIDGKNVTYTAKWVKNPTTQYTVTFRSGSNGSFTNANDPLISQNVESGKTVTGTPDITADRNYRFTGWQIGGAGTVYTRAQVMAMAITDDTVFIASYTYNGGNSGGGGGSVTGYVIKASAGANGSISPSGSVSVSAGGNKTFTITANAGYKISDVLVDGKSVGAVDSYMFEKVRANHTIEALFAKEGGVEDPKISGVADWLNTEEHVAFMTGYENGTFGAENAVTRAQVAQIFFNLLKDKDVRITVNFADVGANAWYAKAVNTLGSLGIVSGVGDKCFDPNRAITRAEFTAIAARFAKANETGSVRFSDVPVNAWYYNTVLTAVNYGWITGVGDNRFAPGERITRAEAATIVNRMLARSADKAYVDATALRQFPDLSTSHWAYYQIMEASNAHGHRTNADGSESWTNLH